MLNILVILFVALLGGFFYRCRGGFLGTGSTFLARLLFWAIPVAVWGLCADWQVGLLCGVMAYVGLLIPHSIFQSNNSLFSVVGMAGVGLARMLLILAPIAYFIPSVLIVLPLAMLQGLAYYIGWTFLNGVDSKISTSGFTVFGFTFEAGHFAISGGEWGEFLTGVVFGGALATALLNFV